MTLASDPADEEAGPAVNPVQAELDEIMTRWERRVDTALQPDRVREGVTTRLRAQQRNHFSEAYGDTNITDWDEPGENDDDGAELDY